MTPHITLATDKTIARYSISDPNGRTIISGNNVKQITHDRVCDGIIETVRIYTMDGMALRVHYDKRGPEDTTGATIRFVLEKDGVKAGLDKIDSIKTHFDGERTIFDVTDLAGRRIKLNNFGIEQIITYNGPEISEIQRFTPVNGVSQVSSVADGSGKILRSFYYAGDNSCIGSNLPNHYAGLEDGVIGVAEALYGTYSFYHQRPNMIVAVVGEEASGKGAVTSALRNRLQALLHKAGSDTKVVVISADRWFINRYGGQRPTDLYLDKMELLGERGFYHAIEQLSKGEDAFCPLFDSVNRRREVLPSHFFNALKQTGCKIETFAGRRLIHISEYEEDLALHVTLYLSEKYRYEYRAEDLYVDYDTGEIIWRISASNSIFLVEGIFSQHDPRLIPLYSHIIYVECDFDARFLHAFYRYRVEGRSSGLQEEQMVQEFLVRARDEGPPFTRMYLANADIIIDNRSSFRQRYNEFILSLAGQTRNSYVLKAVARHLLYVPDIEAIRALLNIINTSIGKDTIRLAIDILNKRARPWELSHMFDYAHEFPLMRKYTGVSPSANGGRTLLIGFYSGPLQGVDFNVEYQSDERTISRVYIVYPDESGSELNQLVLFSKEDLETHAPHVSSIKWPILGYYLSKIGTDSAIITVIVNDQVWPAVVKQLKGAVSGFAGRLQYSLLPLSIALANEEEQVVGVVNTNAKQFIINDPFTSSLPCSAGTKPSSAGSMMAEQQATQLIAASA